jgi:RimJ/RimL family protein N-acetyltransferase
MEEDRLHNSFLSAVKLTNQHPCKRSFLVAEVKHCKNAAGILGVTGLESKKQIEVGVIFRAEYQRQHLAFEALQLLITFLCDNYDNYDIIADVSAQNRAAIWLAKRLGFEYNLEVGLYELNKQNRP